MKKTFVVTDHGCQFRTGYKAERLRGNTMDCKGRAGNGERCYKLLIFPPESTYDGCTRARDFHVYLNESDPRWPADGSGTGWVEINDGYIVAPAA